MASLMPPTQKKHKILTKILAQKMFKNSPKVASYGPFDLKIGIGLKFCPEITRNYFRSSHGDYFHDQNSFQKKLTFALLCASNIVFVTFSHKKHCVLETCWRLRPMREEVKQVFDHTISLFVTCIIFCKRLTFLI